MAHQWPHYADGDCHYDTACGGRDFVLQARAKRKDTEATEKKTLNKSRPISLDIATCSGPSTPANLHTAHAAPQR